MKINVSIFSKGVETMFDWYKELTNTERRTLNACFGGWTVDALDTQIYSFLIPTLVAAWSMTHTQAGFLGTSALISSSVGGWVAGILCDRIGRVRVMKIAIAWFVFFTVLSGLSNSFEQLLIARTLSGIGFGGEWAAGSVLMGEIIRSKYRGKAVGTVQSAYAIGYAIAALMSSVLFSQLSDTYAWRAMFLLGVTPAIIVVFLLRGVTDPEVFLEAKKARIAVGKRSVSPFAIFSPSVLKTTVLTSLLAFGVQAGAFCLVMWLPTYLRTVIHMSTVDIGYNMFVFTAGSFFGYIGAAYLCDAIGRRNNFFLFTVLNWLVIPCFFYLSSGPILLYALHFALGFAALGIYSALGPYFTELFPTSIRANGQAFSYNFGRGFGAFFPTVVGLLSSSGQLPLREAISILAVASYIFVLLATMLLPETKGRDLDSIPDPDKNRDKEAPSTLSGKNA